MSIDFNGSEITVLAARRANHGVFSSRLDSEPVMYNVGYEQEDEFQVPIFAAKGLDVGITHHLTLTNLPSVTTSPDNATHEWFLDIDAIIIGQPASDTIYTSVYDDLSDAIGYAGDWDSHPDFDPRYYDRSAHIADSKSSGFTFHFNGSSVEWRAGVNADHGNHSIVLDGGTPVIVNSSYFELLPDTTSLPTRVTRESKLIAVFLATNLSESGSHTLTVQNIGSPAGPNNVIDLDRLIVNSTRSPDSANNGTNTTTTTSEPTGSGVSNGPNTGTIAGSVVGAIVGLGLIAFAMWFFYFRGRGLRSKSHRPVDLAGDPDTYEHGQYDRGQPIPPSMTRPANTRQGPHRQMSQPTPYSAGGTLGHESYITAFPPPPASNTTSYPHTSVGHTTPLGYAGNTASSQAAATTAVDSEISNEERLIKGFAQADAGPGTVSSTTSATMSPLTATTARPRVLKVETPSAALSPRNTEDGARETDAGPVRRESEEGRDRIAMLPPAYDDAIHHSSRRAGPM